MTKESTIAFTSGQGARTPERVFAKIDCSEHRDVACEEGCATAFCFGRPFKSIARLENENIPKALVAESRRLFVNLESAMTTVEFSDINPAPYLPSEMTREGKRQDLQAATGDEVAVQSRP